MIATAIKYQSAIICKNSRGRAAQNGTRLQINPPRNYKSVAARSLMERNDVHFHIFHPEKTGCRLKVRIRMSNLRSLAQKQKFVIQTDVRGG